jgi:hypothetical protein
MSERRPASLLDFAIAASIAVVPVLLGVVLLVAVIRPADVEASGEGPQERYLSVRLVAALKTFEPAVLRRSKVESALPDAAGVLSALPECSREWRGPLPWRAWLAENGLARTPPPPPAEQVATRLAGFDAALAAFGGRSNRRVEHPVGFDAGRWFAAARAALAAPIENPDAPAHPLRLRCADLADALAALARSDGAMLESLAWRGSESRLALAHWPEAQEMLIPARQVMRRNPWSGVGGCIYFGGDGALEGAAPAFLAASRSAQRRVCALPELALPAAAAASAPAPGVEAPPPTVLAGEPGLADPLDDSRWSVPPSLQAMLQPLETLRQPTGALYRLQTGSGGSGSSDDGDTRAAANRIVLDGSGVDVGFSIDLTIDPALQAIAQKTAACYTGRQAACRALGLHRQGDKAQPLGEPMLEGAMVRMAAVAVIDVASGRIEALAGALSPCARQEVDGPGRDRSCDPRLPYPVQYRPDALLNPAVFHDAMPASTVKPIMAAAFLSDPDVGARWLAAEQAAMRRDGIPARESLRGQLMRSDSARFLDRMFCSEKNYADCRRPWQVQAMATSFGWNAGCAEARSDCGKRDLLSGSILAAPGGLGSTEALTTPVAFGRLMSEPLAGKAGAAMHLMKPTAHDAGILRRCAAGADARRVSDDDWEKCKGGAVVDTVAEGWGQGHARASALGIAGMMATLAAAANGRAEVVPPHLVDAVRGVASRRVDPGQGGGIVPWRPAAPTAHGLSREAAAVILSGLSYSHRSGTARTACEQVFDAKRCRDIDWLAGKTGTPSFPSDGIALDELARLCPKGAEATLAARAGPCSSLRPYKWYVAAWRDPASPGPWTKAIAVLTERNWLRRNGQVHGSGDHGPNPSAEIAMQIAGRRVGLLTGAPQ